MAPSWASRAPRNGPAWISAQPRRVVHHAVVIFRLGEVGEGFQRFAVEHGVNVRRLSHVFLTRVCGRTAGGLVGMLLTVADDTYPQNQNFDDGESETRVAAHLIRSLESGASGISSLD